MGKMIKGINHKKPSDKRLSRGAPFVVNTKYSNFAPETYFDYA
jgi:hypothetical protein